MVSSKILNLFFLLFFIISLGQNTKGDIRGSVIDGETKNNIQNAEIFVVDSLYSIKTNSDYYGNFTLKDCPTGRILIKMALV